ncbi:hypothetical protein NUW58_g5274 [Xylaria curta]|uniref:Uncharacterized protein n=1 Tax=Xylaria curta TaxID=42375 RepID=A0ACC1P3J2_9PEZI|nr:hypothetical protein NUW58_g5274 [Xylaria curta]
MGSRQQGEASGAQTHDTQVAQSAIGSLAHESEAAFEQFLGYVSLADLELNPCTNRPIFTSRPFDIPYYAPKGPNANSSSQNMHHASEDAQLNCDSIMSTELEVSGDVGLEALWSEPGVDINKVTPTPKERQDYQQKRDGLADMTTGPSCSVCGEPLTFEVLNSGMSCSICGFI